MEESDNNPETLVKKLLAKGEKLPEMYICCGTEDFLLESNRAFSAFLKSQGAAHVYEEGPGMHDMKFWSQSVEKVIPWMFG